MYFKNRSSGAAGRRRGAGRAGPLWAPAPRAAARGRHGGAAAAAGAGGGGLHGEESGEGEHQEDAGPHVPAQRQLLRGEARQASMQQVHQCIECCHAPLAQAQALVTSELEKFQDRLARCTMHCNDKAKDSIDAGNKELQVKRQLESCVTKCVDDHMHLIPTMTKKMKESLLSIGK